MFYHDDASNLIIRLSIIPGYIPFLVTASIVPWKVPFTVQAPQYLLFRCVCGMLEGILASVISRIAGKYVDGEACRKIIATFRSAHECCHLIRCVCCV